MNMQHSSGTKQLDNRKVNQGLIRRLAGSTKNCTSIIDLKDMLGCKVPLIYAGSRDGESKRVRIDHHAEVSAGAKRPPTRIKTSSSLDKRLGEMGKAITL